MRSRRNVRSLLYPSPGALTIYLILSLCLLIISNATHIFYEINASDTLAYFNVVFHEYSAATFDWLDKTALISQLTLFLLWAGIGAVVYMLIWLLMNWYISVHNTVVIGTTYTSVNTHGRAIYWSEIAARSVFRVCSVILIVLLTSVVVQFWYPFSVTLFDVCLSNMHRLSCWGWLALVLAGWLLAWYLLIIFMRLALLRTRIFQ